MFSKIFLRFSIICISAVTAVLLIIGLITPVGDTYFYFGQMKSDLSAVAESDFADNLDFYLHTQIGDEEKEADISRLIKDYSGRLALNENRKIYIFDKDYNYIAPKEQIGDIREKSENLSSASEGTDKNSCTVFGDFADCATVIKSAGNSYILYIRDNKTNLRILIYHHIKFLILGGVISLAAALLVALFITLRIAKPVLKITKRAEGFQQGELYESFDDIKSSEFSGLADAVNHMGYVMTESIRRMNADKHRVEVILEHINNGIMTFNNEQLLIQINSAAKRILKIGNKDIKEITFDKFFKDLGLEVRMAEFSYLEKSNTVEKEIKNGGGYIKAWFIPFKIDGERNAGVVCVFEDITDQFNVMSAMRKFVADVSHELKTPITVISSYTETVLNSYLDDKAMSANLLNIVYREAGKMTELIQNLLDISKYEMNAVHRHDEPFSVDEMLNSLVETFKLQAEKKELSLKYTRMNDIPEFIGSRGDVERAVKNIISNSIKYTSKGDKINIFAGKLHNDIYIKVEDTGWGIPENKLGHLFERFYRVEDEARSRDKGGTGLGLSIAKEIIESYGGNIKIESVYTKYTRVTITLPLK